MATRARKQYVLGALTVIIIVAGLVLLIAALSPGGGGNGLFQRVAGSGAQQGDATIAVIGYGQASAPADTATLQLMVGADRGGYDIGRSLQPTPGATPGVGDVAAAAPIIDALMTAGVQRDDIDVVSSPAFTSTVCFNQTCPNPFRVDVTIRQPRLDQITKLVNAVGQAAGDNDLRIQAIGAGYAETDCSTLQRQARQAAIQDAQNRAQQQADLLHVHLGALQAIGDVAPASGATSTQVGACDVVPSAPGPAATGGSTGLTVPLFDPKTAPVATAALTINLTYAIA